MSQEINQTSVGSADALRDPDLKPLDKFGRKSPQTAAKSPHPSAKSPHPAAKSPPLEEKVKKKSVDSPEQVVDKTGLNKKNSDAASDQKSGATDGATEDETYDPDEFPAEEVEVRQSFIL